jgi:hypothetical protein
MTWERKSGMSGAKCSLCSGFGWQHFLGGPKSLIYIGKK